MRASVLHVLLLSWIDRERFLWGWLDIDIDGTEWALWVTALATTGALIALSLAAYFAHGTVAEARAAGRAALDGLSDARRTRHAQVVISLYEQWASPAMQKAYKTYPNYTPETVALLVERLFGAKREPPSASYSAAVEDWDTLTASADLIETIGVLEQDGALAPDVIYNAWGGAIMAAWDSWEQAVPRFRELTGELDFWEHFEAVALEMRAEKARRDASRATTRSADSAAPAAAPGDHHTSAQGSSVLHSNGPRKVIGTGFLRRHLVSVLVLSAAVLYAHTTRRRH